MSWLISERPLEQSDIPSTAIGFVYIITHIETGKFYVGKKLLTKATPKPKATLKNPKPKKQPRKKSDWETYHGSCKPLLADVKLHGEDKFKREIIQFCNSLSTLSYAEEHTQHLTKCLEVENSYNENIGMRSRKSNIKDKVTHSHLNQWIIKNLS